MQPQPASPVPQHAPPPKSGPNWLKIVGIGCGVLVLLAALCGAGMFFFCKSVTASKDDAQRLDRRLRSAGALRRTCAINEPKPLLVANADPHV